MSYREGHLELIGELEQRLARVRAGGGARATERHVARGKLPARERIERLCDPGAPFLELAPLAAEGLYDDAAPGAGVVAGVGVIHGRRCMVVANDATVKGGTYFPLTVKKHLRAQEVAAENHLPCVYLVDSGGAFLPMQDEVFPDRDHFGRIFFNQANMSERGIPQLAAVMGSCTAGGAYVPAMSDETVIVREQGTIFLGGPPLVKAATGEEVTAEELGGGDVHARTSGVVDHLADDDAHALQRIARHRADAAGAARRRLASPPWSGSRRARRRHAEEPDGLLELGPARPAHALRRARGAAADRRRRRAAGVQGRCTARRWSAASRTSTATRSASSPTTACCSASRRSRARTSSSCATAAGIPLLFVQNVAGFMVGREYEAGGIAKDGAKLVTAVSCARVPKLTVIAGGSFGAGNYGMCGRAYSPRFLWMWPNARISVMGGEQAAAVMTEVGQPEVGAQTEGAVRAPGQPLLRDRAPVGRRRDRPAPDTQRARRRTGRMRQRAARGPRLRHLPHVRRALASALLALAAAPGAAAARTPQELAALTPEQVARAFVGAVNERDPSTPKCELLSMRLRAPLSSPALLGLDTRYPESYTPATLLRGCDTLIGAYNGYVEDCCEDQWTRTDAGAATVVARRGDALQLRVRVMRHFEQRPRRRPGVADVFLLREQGAWRIVSPSLLWELGAGGDPPASFAQLPRYLRALARAARATRREQRRQVRDYLATRVRPQAEPLPWSGSASAVADAERDVVDQGGDAVADQQAPDVDLTGAALRSAGGTLTFELRFRGPVPAEAGIDVTLLQPDGRDGVKSSDWRLSLHDGWASAWNGDVERPLAHRGLRASVAGATLRFALPARQVRGHLRLERPFRWAVTSWHAAPSDRDPLRDPARLVWMDDAPALPAGHVPGAGVLHRP